MNNVVINRTISRMFATLHNDNTSIKSRKHLQTNSYVQIQLLRANLLTTLDRSDFREFVSFDNYRSICKENTKQEQANINCEFDWTTRVINNIRP